MLLARICTVIGQVYYQAQQWIDAQDAYQDALNVLLKFDMLLLEGILRLGIR